jgi:hypothetical protein
MTGVEMNEAPPSITTSPAELQDTVRRKGDRLVAKET